MGIQHRWRVHGEGFSPNSKVLQGQGQHKALCLLWTLPTKIRIPRDGVALFVCFRRVCWGGIPEVYLWLELPRVERSQLHLVSLGDFTDGTGLTAGRLKALHHHHGAV